MRHLPTVRYHPTEAPEGVTVRSLAALEALGEGWVDTPAKFPPPVSVADATGDSTESGSAAADPPQDETPPTDEDRKRLEFYATPVKHVVRALDDAAESLTTDHLTTFLGWEQANPAGTRVTLVEALEKRIAALAQVTIPAGDAPEPPAV